MAIVNKKSSKHLCFVSWSIRGRSTHRSWSPHGYDHNSFDLHFDTGTVPLIPILQIKDPNDHAPLILQPMFVGTFEKFLVYLSSTISSLSPLSLNSFSTSLARVGQLANLSSSIFDSRWLLVSHFSTTDETTANDALSSFCLFYRSEVWSMHFSKDVHKLFSILLITNVFLKILQAFFFQNIRLCQNFNIVNFVLVFLQQQPQQHFILRPCLQLRCPDNTDK